jgi:hypothetical protein
MCSGYLCSSGIRFTLIKTIYVVVSRLLHLLYLASLDNLNSFSGKHVTMDDSLKIKEKVKERYGKIALIGGSCCSPSVGTGEGEGGGGCCTGSDKTVLQPLQSQSPAQVAELVGYDSSELKSIPEASILGVGCGTPTKFAFIKEGNTVVDLGSGAGIDVLLAANVVKNSGLNYAIDSALLCSVT